MAWGAPRGVDDLIQKLKDSNTASTMCILGTRKFGPSEATAFAQALADNTSLSELLASGHPLGMSEARAFGEALSRNTTLRSLCVGDNDFGDEGVRALVEGLRHNRGLLLLDLEYKSISDGESLSSLLGAHPTLQDLRLGRNELGESAVQALSTGLSQNSTLVRLDLSGNKLNAAAAEALGRALSPAAACSVSPDEGGGAGNARRPPPLELLDVSKNPLGDEGGAALFRALGATMVSEAAPLSSSSSSSSTTSRPSVTPTLRVLKAAETGLGAAAAAALAEALSPIDAINCGATHASINGDGANDIGDVSRADAPANDGTTSSPSRALGSERMLLLEALDISKNELGASGTVCLADALSRGGAPRLESLSIGYNEIGDEGAVALGRAAGVGLEVLDLSGNALSGEGIGAVLRARGLREAKLFHNACNDEGVPHVLEALLTDSALETLDLGANGLTGAGFETLLPGLAACSSLRTLEVGANSNDDRAEAAVRASQTSNPGLDIAFRRGGEAMEGSGAPAADVLSSPGTNLGGQQPPQ